MYTCTLQHSSVGDCGDQRPKGNDKRWALYNLLAKVALHLVLEKTQPWVPEVKKHPDFDHGPVTSFSFCPSPSCLLLLVCLSSVSLSHCLTLLCLFSLVAMPFLLQTAFLKITSDFHMARFIGKFYLHSYSFLKLR